MPSPKTSRLAGVGEVLLISVSDVESLESTISQLTSANTTLDAEVNDLMRRVASGEYNPALERCIELKANPAAKVQAVRTKELDDLRRENEALLDRLKADTGGAEAGVPNASFERLRVEKEELERAHAKRLLRLKEVGLLPLTLEITLMI